MGTDKQPNVDAKGQDPALYETISVELPNKGKSVSAVTPADYTVKTAPINIKKGAIAMIDTAYLSVFRGANITQQSIVLEEDYTFTMQAALVNVNLCDNCPSSAFGNPLTMGLVTILPSNPATSVAQPPRLIDIPITINKGVYTPQGLCEIFNNQSNKQAYFAFMTPGGIIELPNGATTKSVTLPYEGVQNYVYDGIAPGFTAFEIGVGDESDDYGWLIEAAPIMDGGLPKVFYLPTNQYIEYGSLVGIQLNFDQVQNKFFISQNFTPIVSGDNSSFAVLRFPTEPPANSQSFSDRCGEILIQNWGWTKPNFANSFWARLGFAVTDLYRVGQADVNAWGRCYANINALSINTDVNTELSSSSLSALKIQQQLIDANAATIPTYEIATYDGSTIGIYASSSSVLCPLSYLRARLDLTVAGGLSASGSSFGFTQTINLLSLSDSGITSFSVINPIEYTIPIDMCITSIRVILIDPRTDEPITWITSTDIISAIMLRIIQPW